MYLAFRRGNVYMGSFRNVCIYFIRVVWILSCGLRILSIIRVTLLNNLMEHFARY